MYLKVIILWIKLNKCFYFSFITWHVANSSGVILYSPFPLKNVDHFRCWKFRTSTETLYGLFWLQKSAHTQIHPKITNGLKWQLHAPAFFEHPKETVRYKKAISVTYIHFIRYLKFKLLEKYRNILLPSQNHKTCKPYFRF